MILRIIKIKKSMILKIVKIINFNNKKINNCKQIFKETETNF